MKVLISAFCCNPMRGSEPGAGWAWARAAATQHEVWLITEAANRTDLEIALAKEPNLRIRPIYVALSNWVEKCVRLPGAFYPYYFFWQRRALKAACRIHAEQRFDLGHHITLGADWMPTCLARVPDLPLVWGPVGGTTSGPAFKLWRYLGVRGAIREAARSLTEVARWRWGDTTARRASLLLAQNNDVAQRFRKISRVIVEPHIALNNIAEETKATEGRPDRSHRQAVFVGRLVAWKGIRIAIRALAHPAASAWRLDILGDGPEMRACRSLVSRLSLNGRVRFHGWRPREETIAIVRDADCLLFPSLHDSAGWAVAEALALGVPVVCLDRAGPGILVTAENGEKVPVDGDIVADVAQALGRVGKRIPSVRRWNADRLPALLDNWYGQIATPPKEGGRPNTSNSSPSNRKRLVIDVPG